MTHDIEAAWATSEIAHLCKNQSEFFFQQKVPANEVSTVAGIDNRTTWPIADGIIQYEHPSTDKKYNIAVEYKRKNEGLHGILTALGQAHAYLYKGFSAATIVIPEKYTSHQKPGQHIRDIIELNSPQIPITVLTYSDPDVNNEAPFRNKLECLRSIEIDNYTQTKITPIDMKISTQWGHMREGSSDSHAFFCYLKTAKELPVELMENEEYTIPNQILDLKDRDYIKYLSNSSGNTYHDHVWRYFWFSYVLSKDMLTPWTESKGVFKVNHVPSSLKQPNGKRKNFFSGKSNSIKNKLVEKLNNKKISEQDALKEFIKNVKDRAHSYREDIDSGLESLGLLDQDGRPSELGYRFIDACERTGKFDEGISHMILGSALLNNANYGAFLHYIYKVSERIFRSEPMSFSKETNGKICFNQKEYLFEISRILANELNVMRTVSPRGGQTRQPFQAELAILRRFNYVSKFRLGVGLEINWPEVQKGMNFL
ncbi:MAG: hypothetical protein ACQETL_19390 [Bacteroidota bacterium]